MSLRRSLLVLLLGLLIGTAAIIMTVSYVTTRDSIFALRDDILTQVNDAVHAKTEAYFARAEPILDYVESAIMPDARGVSDWKETGYQFGEFLKSEPHFSWFYFGEASTGHLIGNTRLEDGRYLITRSHEESGRFTKGYEMQGDGSLLETDAIGSVDAKPYDSRTRPWYQLAVASPGDLVWTDSYVFHDRDVCGITAARAVMDASGEVRGVFAIDLLLNEIAAYLDGLRVGKSGVAFLVTQDGKFLIHPTRRNKANIDSWQTALAAALPSFDEMVSPGQGHFEHDSVDYMAVWKPIDLPGDRRFVSAVMVPKADFLGIVNRNRWIALSICAAIIALATVLGVTYASRITTPLEQISSELERIGDLRFPDDDLHLRSPIREITLFNDSLGKMKVSLQSFSRYVPSDLVRRLLADGHEAELGGRVQQVTAEFTDLAGFTGISESLPPDQVFEELSAFLEIIAKHQNRLGGITSNFTGDGTLALFNAPDALANHSQCACQAALDAMEELDAFNEKRASEGKPELRTRVGINTADVLLGNVGTRERFAYTAVGDGVNLASRLEGLNKLYGTSILVGEESRRLVGDSLNWRMVDRISVVGREAPTEIYEPLNGPSTELVERYEKALGLYFKGHFAEASALFDRVMHDFPSDAASRVMKNRCDDFQKTPMGSDWNGAYTAPFK